MDQIFTHSVTPVDVIYSVGPELVEEVVYTSPVAYAIGVVHVILGW